MSAAVMFRQSTAPRSTSLRSGSSEADDGIETVKLRVSYGGNFVQGSDGKFKYQGGESHLVSIPRTWRHADLMHRLAERYGGAVTFKYFEPTDDMDPDNLITVSDDDDLEEMIDEYLRALRLPGTPVRTFRLRAVLFRAMEQDLTFEELADGEAFFTYSESEAAVFKVDSARLLRGTSDTLRRSSQGSSGSSGAVQQPGSDADLLWHEGFNAGWESGATRRTLEMDAVADSYGDGYDNKKEIQGGCELRGVGSTTSWSACGEDGLGGWEARDAGLSCSRAATVHELWRQHSDDAALEDGAGELQQQQFSGFAGHQLGLEVGKTAQGAQHSNSNKDASIALQLTANGSWGASELAVKLAAASPFGTSVQAYTDLSGGSSRGRAQLPKGSERISPRGSPVALHEAAKTQADSTSGCFSFPPGATNAVTIPVSRVYYTQDTAIKASSVFGKSASPATSEPKAGGLPSHISVFGELSDAPFGSPATVAIAACLPEHLFSVDGKTDDHVSAPAKGMQHPPWNVEVEREWAPVAAAPAGEGREYPAVRVPRTVMDVSATGPPTPGATADGAVVLTHLHQRSAESVGSAALPVTGVHRVLKEDLDILGSIGEGAFGDVSLAHSPMFGKVATKWLKPNKVERHTESFWREAEMLAAVNHPNVLRFYGVILESAQDQSVVGIMTEYMRDGSLATWLRQQQAYLPLSKRAALALDVVNGLAYLHAMHIVHFDLKPDNLLLDGNTVKVADFGLSKHKHMDGNYVSGVKDLRGTLPYMAPELVSDPERVSEKADVWSLGMVLWELLTLEVPFTQLSPQQIIHGLMIGNLQPPVPDWCEEEWRSLMEVCWVVNPANRPNLLQIRAQLERVHDMALANGL